MTPRVLFVSRERFRLPLDDAQRRKWDAVGELLDYRILAAAQPGSPLHSDRLELARPRPAFDGPAYYAQLPARIARALRAFRPDAAVVQGVHEASAFLLARGLARARTKLVLDVQGDWHEATRLYGSPARRLLNPANDALGVLALRRADAIRTISPFTSAVVRRAGREPDIEFPTFVDREAFIAPPRPLPERRRVLFVGVLERIKGFDVLAAAWPRVRQAIPDAELHVVGRGRLTPPDGATWTPTVDRDGVAAAMDAATVLCLPSRAEGFGRVVVEAMLRGRAVVGADAGSIPDLVEDDVNGLLVEPGSAASLATALERILGDRDLAERLGARARVTGEAAALTPTDYAARLAAVVAGLP
ncbi:MAG: glycosyltransferase family 4 protein [Actinobacteria bacterium]|nr:glycosyltransferase family 4 protein [Actinomycetota bacterium]MBV8479325.1 glycosyltransferase family 4 protein [Actinomycetota bacterium]